MLFHPCANLLEPPVFDKIQSANFSAQSAVTGGNPFLSTQICFWLCLVDDHPGKY
jgi:hypothetical protein